MSFTPPYTKSKVHDEPPVYIGREYVDHDPKSLFGVLKTEVIDWLVDNGLKALPYPDYQEDWTWDQHWDQGKVVGAILWIRDPDIRLMFKLAWAGQ